MFPPLAENRDPDFRFHRNVGTLGRQFDSGPRHRDFMEYTKNEDKLLAAASYVFFIPSLYIILTEKRGIKFLSFAAAQSLVLWIPYIIFLVMLRIILNLIWSLIYLPIDAQVIGFCFRVPPPAGWSAPFRCICQ